MPTAVASGSCRHCAKLIRPDTTVCGFCGAATATVPDAAPIYPMPEVACPVCDDPVLLYALGCVNCGVSFENRDTRARARRLKDDRSVLVQMAATVSLVGLFAVIGFFLASRASSSWVPWAITAGLFVGGLALAAAGVVVAFRDLTGMAAGRVDADGRARAVCGGVTAGFSVLLYWAAAGCGVCSLL